MSKKNTKVKKENKKSKSKEKDLDVEVVKTEVDDVQKEKEKFLRLFAEFENYKKRTTRERIELFSTASQELMTSLLPVLDDFDRANQEIIKNSDDEIYKGVSLIQNKLFDTLKQEVMKSLTLDLLLKTIQFFLLMFFFCNFQIQQKVLKIFPSPSECHQHHFLLHQHLNLFL